MAVSKRLKYEILRRDGHACRYCGAKAPAVELTVDHVTPVALGGTDDPSNLVAACGDCNSGKTSSSPDAPLVAEVSEDALRWSRALAEAARRMREGIAGHETIYAQFDEWWYGWDYGRDRLPIPRPDDWRNSVDNFLAAGLPLEALKSCVEIAMGSRAKPDATWRYMCGVAWRKIAELQESARSIIAETEPGPGAVKGTPRTPDEYAERLLAELDEKDRARAYKDEDRVRDDPDEPAETNEGRASGALWFALRNLECDRKSMVTLLSEILHTWPDGRGDAALAEARRDLEGRFGSDFDENDALINATWDLAQDLQAERAEEFLAPMTASERAAWVQRARDAWTSSGRDLGFDDRFYAIEAANMAREAKAEDSLTSQRHPEAG